MTANADPHGSDPFVTGPHLRMWLASTLAVEALVVPALVLALAGDIFAESGSLISAVIALVVLLVAPLAAWCALIVCRRESTLEPLTRSGIVRAHLAVGFAFGGGVPITLALAMSLPMAVGMASQGQGVGAFGVLGAALIAGMILAFLGLLVSVPLSILGGAAALAAACRPT